MFPDPVKNYPRRQRDDTRPQATAVRRPASGLRDTGSADYGSRLWFGIASMAFTEKRRHPRMAIHSAALTVCDGQGYLSEVRDLSQGGARIALPKNWPQPAPSVCRVFFIFDQETVIGIDARVVHTTNTDMGLEFLPDQNDRIEKLLYESRFLDRESP